MITTRTNETLQEGLYYEWVNNLAMYQQELEHLEHVLTGTGNKDLDAAIELDALKELIEAQHKVIADLIEEVLQKKQHLVPAGYEGIIAFADVLRNNHLREKIRKVEHSVFYLKYHVHKLLSIAS
jgi:hypothetical protein